MPRKERFIIQRDDELRDIDEELDAAIGRLDGANERVGSILQALDKNEPIPLPDTPDVEWHDETSATPARARADSEEE